MARQQGCLRAALVLAAVFGMPVLSWAGPFFGEWGWCWHPDRDCPRGKYCFLHHWLPEYYRVRAHVHPVSLDQFPAGPPVNPAFKIMKHPCPTVPPTPPSPYLNPADYYGIGPRERFLGK